MIDLFEVYDNIMGEVVLIDIYDTFSPVEISNCIIYGNTIHYEEEGEEEEEEEVDDFSLF